ncbi:MAG: hypothetical protein D6714_08240 [Bacteroidetes bacterium]|nr:MAG: hypothetical protein D6714_08240 [Bacteroidota bacterium]
MVMKKLITAIIAFCLPSKMAVRLLNLLGHKVHPSARIGFSFLYLNGLYLDKNTRIGHFNLIVANKLLMRKGAFIKHLNRVRGAINLLFGEEAALATSNSVFRGEHPDAHSLSTLKLGKLGQIVAQNKLDLTRSISIGHHSTIGGYDGQFWTHGYVHETQGKGRIRVDGEIVIGNNVYIGSRCTFNPGIYIADGCTVGAHVCVSKSLLKRGMYVAQPLRMINQDINKIRFRLKRDYDHLIEEVYEKDISHQINHHVAAF